MQNGRNAAWEHVLLDKHCTAFVRSEQMIFYHIFIAVKPVNFKVYLVDALYAHVGAERRLGDSPVVHGQGIMF